MSNRIRYAKTDQPYILRSVKDYQHPTNGGRFYILLNEEKLAFKIYDDVAEMVAVQGTAVSLHKLKIAAKDALVKLGIGGFEKEERVKKIENS